MSETMRWPRYFSDSICPKSPAALSTPTPTKASGISTSAIMFLLMKISSIIGWMRRAWAAVVRATTSMQAPATHSIER